MKKHLIFWTLAVIALSSCGKINSDGLYSRAYGEEVVFSLSNTSSPLKTKAEYSGDIDGEGIERIDWVIGDVISVACAQAENTSFNYTVSSVTVDGHESDAELSHDPGETGLRWKDEGIYNFYATSPVSTLFASGEAAFTLPRRQAPSSESGWNEDHTNFKAAVSSDYMQMTAKTSVEKEGEDPGDPVDLPFVMLPTVLEFTLKGEADMVVDSVKLESENWLTGEYQVHINQAESPGSVFPSITLQSRLQKRSAAIGIRDGGYPVEIKAATETTDAESLTFTFMLLPTKIQDLTFYLTRIVSGEPYTVKTELRYSDSYLSDEFLTFDAHKKYLIKGMVVPESVKWEIEGEVIVTPLVTVTSTDEKDYFNPIFE